MNISFNTRANRWAYTEGGFILLEALLSLALALLLLGGVLSLLLLGMNDVSRGGERTAACIYAGSLLEEMKSRPEMLTGLLGAGQASADSLPFLTSPPPGLEAEISIKPLAGAQRLYVVKVEVLTVGRSAQWQEFLVGVVSIPQKLARFLPRQTLSGALC